MSSQPPYCVEGGDLLVELADMPQMDVGAPSPRVTATEHVLELRYFNSLPGDPEPMTVVRFTAAIAHYFGPPNDEALAGHPLFGRGLEAYSAFEVQSSSWIRALEVMNRVHDRHNPQSYFSRRHFVFTFHDSTFECVATGYDIEETNAEA